VDVLVVGVAGSGTVTVDGVPHVLAAGTLVIIPKGAHRAIEGTSERFVYLSCHRRRRRLAPRPPAGAPDSTDSARTGAPVR
jgi:mannose-6-phosphate isomerase-like protein (cupin superfamily)